MPFRAAQLLYLPRPTSSSRDPCQLLDVSATESLYLPFSSDVVSTPLPATSFLLGRAHSTYFTAVSSLWVYRPFSAQLQRQQYAYAHPPPCALVQRPSTGHPSFTLLSSDVEQSPTPHRPPPSTHVTAEQSSPCRKRESIPPSPIPRATAPIDLVAPVAHTHIHRYLPLTTSGQTDGGWYTPVRTDQGSTITGSALEARTSKCPVTATGAASGRVAV